MSYSAQISRNNPTCILLVIDQSGSMSEEFGIGDPPGPKAIGTTTAINRILQELVIKCSRETEIRRYFQVGVIGYGMTIGSALPGSLASSPLVWIDDLAMNPLRIEEMRKRYPDGAGGLVEMPFKLPIWFDPVAEGATPMRQALATAHAVLEQWIVQHPNAFPPVVIHFTDGASTDGDPSEDAAAIRKLATTDGNVVLLNSHLSSSKGQQIKFPDSEANLPADPFAKMLFHMSSVMPEYMCDEARVYGYEVSANSRGYVFNADLQDVISFLNIGSAATKALR